MLSLEYLLLLVHYYILYYKFNINTDTNTKTTKNIVIYNDSK